MPYPSSKIEFIELYITGRNNTNALKKIQANRAEEGSKRNGKVT